MAQVTVTFMNGDVEQFDTGDQEGPRSSLDLPNFVEVAPNVLVFEGVVRSLEYSAE